MVKGKVTRKSKKTKRTKLSPDKKEETLEKEFEQEALFSGITKQTKTFIYILIALVIIFGIVFYSIKIYNPEVTKTGYKGNPFHQDINGFWDGEVLLGNTIFGCLDSPSKGRVILDGQNISRLTENELAQIRGKKNRVYLSKI